MAQTGERFETLAELADNSPIKTYDAEISFVEEPHRLRIGNSSFAMGICTNDQELARGLHEYKFKTGPYLVRVVRNSQNVNGTSYRIEVDRQ